MLLQNPILRVFTVVKLAKYYRPFGIESMPSTQVSNTNKKLDEGFEP